MRLLDSIAATLRLLRTLEPRQYERNQTFSIDANKQERLHRRDTVGANQQPLD